MSSSSPVIVNILLVHFPLQCIALPKFTIMLPKFIIFNPVPKPIVMPKITVLPMLIILLLHALPKPLACTPLVPTLTSMTLNFNLDFILNNLFEKKRHLSSESLPLRSA